MPEFISLACVPKHITVLQHPTFEEATTSALKSLHSHIKTALDPTNDSFESIMMELDIINNVVLGRTSLQDLKFIKFTKFAPFDLKLNIETKTFNANSNISDFTALVYEITKP